MPGGRPTKYDKKYCDMIIEYFRVPATREVYQTEYYQNGEEKTTRTIIVPTEFPTFQGFADANNINFDTLKEWCEVHPEFSAAYAHAKKLQEKIWLQNSMAGLYNPQFAQFFGKNCLGYKDKTEVENSGEQTLNVNIKVMDNGS